MNEPAVLEFTRLDCTGRTVGEDPPGAFRPNLFKGQQSLFRRPVKVLTYTRTTSYSQEFPLEMPGASNIGDWDPCRLPSGIQTSFMGL